MNKSEIKKRRSFLLDEEGDKPVSKSIDIPKFKPTPKVFKYRTEQVNSTTIEDEVRSHSELKKQFEVDIHPTDQCSVKLTDLHYEFTPPVMGKVYEFVSHTERIRNDIRFTLDNNGRLNKILNRDEIFDNWQLLKKNDLSSIEFIKTLKKDNKEQYNNMLEEGDKQFSPQNEAMEEDYHRDLLYLVLFDKHLTATDASKIEKEEYIYTSQLFPQVEVPMQVRYDVVDESEKSITIRKVADSIINDQLIKNIEHQYNMLHKPLIKYSFTAYKLTFRTRYTLDKESRIINDAEVTIIEDVEHNIKSVCKFNLKRLIPS